MTQRHGSMAVSYTHLVVAGVILWGLKWLAEEVNWGGLWRLARGPVGRRADRLLMALGALFWGGLALAGVIHLIG